MTIVAFLPPVSASTDTFDIEIPLRSGGEVLTIVEATVTVDSEIGNEPVTFTLNHTGDVGDSCQDAMGAAVPCACTVVPGDPDCQLLFSLQPAGASSPDIVTIQPPEAPLVPPTAMSPNLSSEDPYL